MRDGSFLNNWYPLTYIWKNMSLIFFLRSTTTLVYESQAKKHYTDWWIIECFAPLVTCTDNPLCSSVKSGMIGDVLSLFFQSNGRGMQAHNHVVDLFVIVPSSFFHHQYPFPFIFLRYRIYSNMGFSQPRPTQSNHINTLIDSVYQVSQIHKCQHMCLYWHRLLILGLGLGTLRASVLLKAEAPLFRRRCDPSQAR